MQCQNCGRSIKDGSVFCPSCGTKIEFVPTKISLEEENRNNTGTDTMSSSKKQFSSEKTNVDFSKDEMKESGTKKQKKISKKNKVCLIVCFSFISLCVFVAGVLLIIHKINTTPVGNSGLSNIEIRQVYEEAESCFEDGNHEEALVLLKTIPSKYMGFSKIQSTRKKILEDYTNEICKSIESYLESNKFNEASLAIQDASDAIKSFSLSDEDYYDDIISKFLDTVFLVVDDLVKIERDLEAIKCLESVSVVLNDSSSFDKKRESVIAISKQKFISKAELYAEEGKYDEALSTLRSFSDVVTNDEEISNVQKKIEKKQILDDIEQFEANGDFEGGIKYINSKKGLFKSDGDIGKKLNIFKEKYRSKVLFDAEEAFDSGSYLNAIDVLNASQELLPNDSIVSQKIEEYKTYAPVSIKNFKITSSNGYEFHESASDPREEVAVDVIELEYYVEFYLGGDYSKFSARIDPTRNFNTSGYQGVQLKILADDVEVYQSQTITYKTDNLDLSVDIRNADYLAFELVYVGGNKHSEYWSADPILIYNAFVSK